MDKETILKRATDIYKRHNQGVTLSYLAREYGISRERASQIYKGMKPRILMVQGLDGEPVVDPVISAQG